MQAIQVKFLGPTNYRGSRYKASCDAKTLTVHSDHALNPSENEYAVARALADSLGWTEAEGYGRLVGGHIPDGSAVFVFVTLDGAEIGR